MASRLQLPVDDSVQLRVTHSNIKSFSPDVRFSPGMTVESVKEKLWKKCGTSVDSMRLELYDDAGAKVCDVNDNSRPLGFYSPEDGYRLHIIDLDPSSVTSGGWLEDTSLVEKYKISEEAYSKLDCNFRKFKEKMISQNTSGPENKLSDNYMEDLCEKIKVGDRCEVEPGEKRGVVKFVGRAETVAPGYWVGIQLDEPLGKHDGTVKGKRYFDCPPQHGLLLRPDKVKKMCPGIINAVHHQSSAWHAEFRQNIFVCAAHALYVDARVLEEWMGGTSMLSNSMVGDYPERDPFDEEEI